MGWALGSGRRMCRRTPRSQGVTHRRSTGGSCCADDVELGRGERSRQQPTAKHGERGGDRDALGRGRDCLDARRHTSPPFKPSVVPEVHRHARWPCGQSRCQLRVPVRWPRRRQTLALQLHRQLLRHVQIPLLGGRLPADVPRGDRLWQSQDQPRLRGAGQQMPDAAGAAVDVVDVSKRASARSGP